MARRKSDGQLSFTDVEYAGRPRKGRRQEFLERMDEIVPWEAWVAIIEPHYPSGRRGRPPYPIETMLRMYLLQCWFNLSDEATEDAIYDSFAMRSFMHLDFSSSRVPDATTLLHFRHLLEERGLQEALFDALAEILERSGVMMRGGSIVDATIVEAPSSTKNSSGARDPEMHQVRKGNQWHFGMKCHVGVDAGSGLVHTVAATPANVADVAEAHRLLREDDRFCYADAGYTGIAKRPEVASDPRLSAVEWFVAMRPGKLRALPERSAERDVERRKASVRSKVEHPFRIVKGLFGYSKAVYRGLRKNLCRLHMLFALSNLEMCSAAGRSLLPA